MFKEGTQGTPPPAKKGEKRYTAMLRSDFYRDYHYPIFIICILIIAICTAFVLGGIYERTLTPAPEYFPVTADGKLVAPTPLSQPGITTPALLQWAVESIITSFTFNFIDYDRVITEASAYFTQAGYQAYRRALLEHNVVGAVERRKYVLSAVPTSAPIILREKPTDGIYSWLVQYPIQLTFQNLKELVKKDMIITMLIVRVPLSESPTGVAINALIVREGRLIT